MTNQQPRKKLHLLYRLQEERTRGGWAVKAPQFLNFATGATREEARRAFREWVKLTISEFTDEDSIKGYLDTCGVTWWLEHENGARQNSPHPTIQHQVIQIP